MVLTTSPQPQPAASSTAVRLAITRSVSGSIPPSTSAPVAGSSAAWPARNRKPSTAIAWLYGPIAAGAPVVEMASAGHGWLLLLAWLTITVAMTSGSAEPGDRRVVPPQRAARTVSAAAAASVSEA